MPARRDAEIGKTFISEMIPVRGAHVVGPLPAPLDNITTYAAAVSRPDPRCIWGAAGLTLAEAGGLSRDFA